MGRDAGGPSEDPEAAYDEDDDGTVDQPYQPDRESLWCFSRTTSCPGIGDGAASRRSAVWSVRRLSARHSTRTVYRPARYEGHLDRKLERTLATLLKLQDLRRTIMPDGDC